MVSVFSASSSASISSSSATREDLEDRDDLRGVGFSSATTLDFDDLEVRF